MAGYDKDATKVEALRQEAENRNIRGAAEHQGVHRACFVNRARS